MSVPVLSAADLARALAVRDLTDSTAGRHAVQLLVDDVARALTRHWSCEARIERRDRVVTLTDNYDALGYSPDAVTRDARYTRYVSEHEVLRSHTSALVPGALRVLASEGSDGPDDVVLVLPGVVYRRDSIDRLHTGTPHQLDVWRITRSARMTAGDLKAMIDVVVNALVPGAHYRAEDRVHPYTTNGLQIDVDDGAYGDHGPTGTSESWIEVAECGLAAPHVLAHGGLDPDEWTGLAMGIGLDRALMLRKGVHDIRLLRSEDPRIASQMTNLTLYRPVSNQPGIARDLSVAVDADDDVEELGDRVRDALGDDAEAVETVEIVAQTDGAELPDGARQRLGLRDGQKNVLVRVVLRHPSHTLTRDEANDVRDRVYAAIHRGDAEQWAGDRPDPTKGG